VQAPNERSASPHPCHYRKCDRRDMTSDQVVDTDAEGRLCLADSLVYAESLGVEAMVDIATLTGATLTALGEGIGGLYSPNERMARSLAEAAQDAGELTGTA